MTIAEKATAGIKWSSVSQLTRQVTQFAATLVLVRLLAPADFGLMGMATVICGFAGLFHDLGTSAAIIQKQDVSENLLSSILWINVIFGAVITSLLILLAPLLSVFYHEPRITGLLRVLSLTFCISGMSISQQSVLERGLAFDLLAKIEIISAVTSTVAAIYLAWSGAGVWSLVCQTLLGASISTVLLWCVSSWKPRLILDWHELKSVQDFSLNLTGFSIFNYFIRNADNVLIGKFLGATNLGYYTLAYTIMSYPLQAVSSVIGRVMFPLFSKIQDDNARFRVTYLKINGAIALCTFPLMLGLWVVAEPFVLAVLGVKWSNVIPLIWILAPLGMVQSIGTTAGIIYQAKGRTDLLLRWGVAAGLTILAAFAIGLHWGIVGVAAAYAIASLILTYPSFAIPFKLIGLPTLDLATTLRRPFICSLIMLLFVFVAKSTLASNLGDVSQLAILVPLGLIIYCIAIWQVSREELREILCLVGVKI